MVLRAEINIGYEELTGQLATLNGAPRRPRTRAPPARRLRPGTPPFRCLSPPGEPVHGLKNLLERVERQTEGNLVFRLDSGEMMVLPVAKWRATEEEIFATHCIAHRASADLRAVTASA